MQKKVGEVPKKSVKKLDRLPAAGACCGPLGALALLAHAIVEQGCNDGLAVEDATGLDLSKQFAEGDGEELNLLVVFRLGIAGREIFGEEDLHPLAEEAGTGVVAHELGPELCLVARLFEQLALRTGQWIFARVEAARRNFIEVLRGSVTILTLEQDERIALALRVVDGKDDNGAGVTHDVAAMWLPARLMDFLSNDAEHRAFETDLRGQDFNAFGVDTIRLLLLLCYAFLLCGHPASFPPYGTILFEGSAPVQRRKIERGAAVIGLGNWGSSLAAALDAGGLLRERVHARRRGSRMRLDAKVLWLCVPDAAIARTAEWLVARRGDLSGQMMVHSSGALDRHVLAVAERAGARTGSVHPMMSFPTRRVVALRGTRFGVEAEDAATGMELFTLVRRLGGRPFAIDGRGKAMYHAGAMFGSPLVVATLAAGVRAMRVAGIAEREALALLGPMAAATVANVQKQGLARSFSGPLARGDAATVKLHREALAGHPLVAHVYDGLARLAAEDLPSADRVAIETALGEDSVENRKRHLKRH